MKLTPNSAPGRLVVFEGTDGAGKTTLIGRTEDYLSDLLGRERVLVVKQPTDLSRKTKLFQKMMYCRSHEEINYRAVQLLTLSDRVQHNSEVIMPALAAGIWVICDRYVFTSVANMRARGYTREKWFYLVAREIVRPDAVFFADAPPEIAIERIKSRPSECDRHLDEDLLRRVHAEFIRLSRSEKFYRADTSGCADAAFDRVKRVLERMTGERR